MKFFIPQPPENIKMNFFESITCLEVTVKDDNVYHCIVTDGEIKGMCLCVVVNGSCLCD